MAKFKSNVKSNNINPIRVCDLSIVPLNQLQTLSERGYCVVMIKQGKDSLCPELTTKEKECLGFLIRGLPAKAIAQDTGVDERVIRSMLVRIRKKFNVDTNHALVSKVYQMGIDGAL
ncbi:helix-turn-helix transcriptional regulator [Cysteiniphilum halobium]|uniref:helix-turn-helix transcriptional regulator n=1 Tax=Cysteiniphilum halobium TaxID=2219059 RepID=UPI000E657AAF|nr:LuxR C-terminal-related transcriptional regulator [Cysteiniphilum halobium]